MSSRWQHKVVDAPAPFRAHESHRKAVDASNKHSVLAQLPGPNIVLTPRESVPHTPVRKGAGSFASPTAASAARAASCERVYDSPLSLITGDLNLERYSRKMVTPNSRRSSSPLPPHVGDQLTGLSPRPMSAVSNNIDGSTRTDYLFSKRMSPCRQDGTSAERPLSTAKTNVLLDRGRTHSRGHRNYTDTIHDCFSARPSARDNSASPIVAGINIAASTPVAGSTTPVSSRPSLKNIESARTEAGHWKPTISKRCPGGHTPSLVGVMRPDAPQQAAPYRVVPPFGVS